MQLVLLTISCSRLLTVRLLLLGLLLLLWQGEVLEMEPSSTLDRPQSSPRPSEESQLTCYQSRGTMKILRLRLC